MRKTGAGTRRTLLIWLGWLASGSVVLGTSGAGCLADSLRDLSDELDDVAAEIDGRRGPETEFGEILDELAELF